MFPLPGPPILTPYIISSLRQTDCQTDHQPQRACAAESTLQGSSHHGE